MRCIYSKCVSPVQFRVRSWLSRVIRQEDGGMIIFGLFIFILILAVCGIAVDVMRYEQARVRLQGSLDRAVLAAADLDQTQSPDAVVRDYLTMTGLLGTLDGAPTVQQGINFRSVNATAWAPVNTYFMRLLGVDELVAPASSTAEERISNVEISLVLDISSSMLSDRRFDNLKPAARTFVDTVLANNSTSSTAGLVSVSMIPYSAVVNPGPAITNQMNLSATHTYSACPLFPDSSFTTTGLDLSRLYARVGHFDYGASTNTNATPITRPWCYPGTLNQIVVHSTSNTALHNAINSLAPFGNTAIDLGAKWGVALLDTSTRTMVRNIVGNSSPVAGRPLNITTDDVLKVLVLMTDGENTTEYDLASRFKTDLSTVWVWKQSATQAWGSVPQNRISIRISDNNTPNNFTDDRFFWLGQSSNSVRNYPQGFPAYVNLTGEAYQPGRGIDHTNVVRHLSWQDVFATWVRTRIYSYLFAEPYQRGQISYATYIETYYALDSVVESDAADRRLDAICNAAKAAGVIVYTVSFEASFHGQETLASCASSPSHYFDVSGTAIATAFSAIATDIRQLKLIQ